MGIFWELHQYRQIGEAQRAAERSVSESATALRVVQEMEDRLDKLTLVCMALWSLLQEKTGVTEEDLVEKVREIDLKDGKLDGKVRPRVAHCPSCNRKMSPRHKRCLYCGAENLSHTPFDETL